ncbi:MAG: extracellular solute-binding protein, partial [Ktedonobacteraceae bacterium]|nr:extracellular solute-binding protein [Ktedonobacteraceae bacterium]
MQDQTSAFSLDRRRFLTTTAGVVGALAGMNLLQACGASGGSSGSNTLSFLGHETADQVKDLITGFEAAHQGVSVQYQPVPFDQINDVLQTRLGSRDVTPDVYTADQPRMAALHHRNFLADITGKVGSDKNAVLPASLQASSLDGKIYSLPMATSTQLLYYNTALLEKAGVTPPETDQDKRWTWEQLVAAAQKAQAGGAKWGFIFEQVSRYYQLQSLFESAGAGSGLTGQGLLTPAITSPGW